MESNRAGFCCVRMDDRSLPAIGRERSRKSYFNKNDRTIRLLLNLEEDDLEYYSVGYISFRQHFLRLKFINLPVIPIYVMFTRFDGKHYF